MENIHALHLKVLQGRLGEIAYELTQVRYRAPTSRSPWQPRINVYRCSGHLVVCADLAGVDRGEIDLRIEPFRVRLAGRRRPPLPNEAHGQPRQILALEIDDGLFEREILLPDEILPDEARAEQHDGLLWIDLPLRSDG